MNIKDYAALRTFLVKAKKNTWAAGESGIKRLDGGEKELTYEDGDFKYRDRYFGSKDFIGWEVVWHKGQMVWGMNYYGKISPDEDEKTTYSFLRKALQNVTEDRPYRGQPNFKEGDFEYFDRPEGKINEFTGKETISRNGKQVYLLHYHGGTI